MKNVICLMIAALVFVTVSCGKKELDEKQTVIEYWNGLAKYVQTTEFKTESAARIGASEQLINDYKGKYLSEHNMTEEAWGVISDKYMQDPEVKRAMENSYRSVLK